MIWCVDCITVVSGSYHTAHTAAALTDLYSDPRPDHLLLSCSVLQLCARTKIVSVLDLTTMSGVFIKEEVKDADEAGDSGAQFNMTDSLTRYDPEEKHFYYYHHEYCLGLRPLQCQCALFQFLQHRE